MFCQHSAEASIQPLKMEPIEGSETSAYNNQTPGKHPKEYIIDSLMKLHNTCQSKILLYSVSYEVGQYFPFINLLNSILDFMALTEGNFLGAVDRGSECFNPYHANVDNIVSS